MGHETVAEFNGQGTKPAAWRPAGFAKILEPFLDVIARRARAKPSPGHVNQQQSHPFDADIRLWQLATPPRQIKPRLEALHTCG